LNDEFLPETIEYFERTYVEKKETLNDMLYNGSKFEQTIAKIILSVGMSKYMTLGYPNELLSLQSQINDLFSHGFIWVVENLEDKLFTKY
jgi:hypothetical protein